MVRTKALPGELQWQAYEDGIYWGIVLGKTVEDAWDAALTTLDRKVYQIYSSETVWVPVKVQSELTGEEKSGQIPIHPEEPVCVNGLRILHDWQSPPHIVGPGGEGIPGIYSEGEGCTSHFVCSRCGRHEHRNSWFLTPHGELSAKVWYREPDPESLVWVESVTNLWTPRSTPFCPFAPHVVASPCPLCPKEGGPGPRGPAS
jgi:hypothetical protein